MNLSVDPRSIQTSTNIKDKATDPKSQELAKLRKSCREFEAIYVNEMYKNMRKSIPDSGIFEKNTGDTLYQEMLDMEMAKQTAAGDGIGIGKTMYEQLKKQHYPDTEK